MDEMTKEFLEMSKHCNGYRREKAVQKLGVIGDPLTIPILIIAVNDWVFQVRKAAREALLKMCSAENIEVFILNLPNIYHLKECNRDKHERFISSIVNYLLQDENIQYVKKAIHHNNRYVARIAVQLCIENSLIEKQELIIKCLEYKDVIIKNLMVNYLHEFSGDTLELLLEKSMQNSFMPIRREAFQIYLRVMPKKGLKIANNFLFDKNPSIREIAIYNLSKNGIKVEEILLNIIKSNKADTLKIKSAILGLAYLNIKKAIPQIEQLCNALFPSIRKVSLQALSKLIDYESKPFLIQGINDQSPRVAKESARLLNKLKIQLSADELFDIINKSHYKHTIKVALLSSKVANKWEKLIFLIGCSWFFIQNKTAIPNILQSELINWNSNFNRSNSQPSLLQKQRILTEYNQCKQEFKNRGWLFLEFTIDNLQ